MQKTGYTPHINASAEDFAKTVLMPGDPKRSRFIAENFLNNARLVNDVRGVQGYTGNYRGVPVSVMASGMGMPAMGIYSYELFNFFDTAEYYNTYHYMAKAFNGDTDGLVISSKSLSESAEGMINAVEEARKALNRDVIDIFLMHEIRGMWDFSWRKKAYAALLDLKAKGIVKAIGVSTHHIDVCEAMADIPEIDVVFPLINYKGLGIRKGDDAGTAS